MRRTFDAWILVQAPCRSRCLLAVRAAASRGGRRRRRRRPSAPEEKVVNVLNWSDYIGETTIADFEKKTGIKVTYDVFDSNEVLETKLLAGPHRLRHRRADRAIPRAADQGRRVPEARQVEAAEPRRTWIPDIMQRVAAHDPGNEYSHHVPLGHDRARLQPGHGQEGARHRHDRQLGRDPRAGRMRRSSRNAASRCSMRRPTSSARSRSTRASTRTARSPRTSRSSRRRS